MRIKFVMQHPRPQFTLTTSTVVFKVCLRAINAYVNKHDLKETAQRQMVQRLKKQLQHNCKAPGNIRLTWAPASFLKESLEFLLHREDQKLQQASMCSKVKDLIGALGDYTATLERMEQEATLTEDPAPTTSKTEEYPWMKIRDDIFRQMIDAPPRIDIWGNILEEEQEISPQTNEKPNVQNKILDLIRKRRRITKSYDTSHSKPNLNGDILPEGWAWEKDKTAAAWSLEGDYCALTFGGIRTYGNVPNIVIEACKQKNTKNYKK